MKWWRSQRWGRRVWLTALVAVGCWTLWMYFGTPPAIPVSRETTYLLPSVRSDGTYDYSTALADHCRSDIPEEQNAAAGLADLPAYPEWRAFLVESIQRQAEGPADLKQLRRYYRNKYGGVLEPGATAVLAVRNPKQEWPWRTADHPVRAAWLDAAADYRSIWCEAVRRPGISSVSGQSLSDLKAEVRSGLELVQEHAMLLAGEGNWPAALAELGAADCAVEHLSHVQCGWELHDALTLRIQQSQFLEAVLRWSASVDEEFLLWLMARRLSSVEELLRVSLDQAVRIRSQLRVSRERRHRDNLMPRDVNQMRDLSNRLERRLDRNTRDWAAVSRVQQVVLDELLQELDRQRAGVFPAVVRRVKNHLSEPEQDGLQREPDAEGLQLKKWRRHAHSVARECFDLAVVAQQTLEAEQRLLLIAHLARYRSVHGHWPLRLEDVKDLVVPVNPTTGEQWQYRPPLFPGLDQDALW